jgi:hypothetical protein
MSSCCYNPFLYAWLNENFRKEFKKMLLLHRCLCFQNNAQTHPAGLVAIEMNQVNVNCNQQNAVTTDLTSADGDGDDEVKQNINK